MLPILFENSHLVVIDKPQPMDFHDDQGVPGVHSRLKQQLGLTQLYPVHRLDKITSGLLLFAKTETACQALNLAFESHEVEKYYLAISKDKPKKKQGKICGDMERARRGAWKLLKSQHNPAVTQFFSYSLTPGVRLFLLKPRTGRTHQLRVAMKSLGAPILGDSLYAGQPSDRVYLHAYAMRFSLFGEEYTFVQAPVQGEVFNTAQMEAFTTDMTTPWALPWPK